MFKVKFVVRKFYGEFTDPRFVDNLEFDEWSLKDKKPLIYSGNIENFSASGEELSYIHSYFRGVPTRMCKDEVIWTGVYAQFIFDNL